MEFRSLAIRASGLLVAACAAPFALPASASEKAVVLEPSSNWYAKLENGSCRLARTFGEGAGEHMLVFEQWGPSSRFGLTIAGPEAAKFSSGSRTDLTFFDEHEAREIRPIKGKLDGFGTSLTEINAGMMPYEIDWSNSKEEEERAEKRALAGFPAIDPGLALKAEYVKLRQGDRTLTFRTGRLNDPFDVLNQCAEQLMVSWGLDLAQQKKLVRRPKLENWRKINERLYANWPSDMLEDRWRGSVNIRVLVDEKGRVDGCQATNLAMTQEMQEATCNSMTRARFDPARDMDGKPVRSFYETTITYRVR